MKTYQPTQKDIKRSWHIMDAKDRVLGRMASEIAKLLTGKQKSVYSDHIDMGDYVVVINAKDVLVTGKKKDQKVYHRHSGYPGGLKSETVKDLLERKPYVIVERAIKGMLPKTKLGKQIGRKLNVYAGPTHPHKAQQPEALAV